MFRIISLLTLFLIVGFQSDAQHKEQVIDSIIQSAVKNNQFEGTILLADKGNVVYHNSFGYTDKNKLNLVDNSAHFSIAFITKMFTAIIIMRFVEEGKINLTDNLKTLLPTLEIPNSNSISVHHLLLHISGLPNENDQIYTVPSNPTSFVNETIKNNFNALGEFNYANIDFVLLGLIIEKYDSMTWENSVKNRILDKLGMNETGFLKKGNYPKNFAYSFSYDTEEMRRTDPLFNIENYYAAGCMYSTASDLLLLDQAMYDDLFISKTSKELMFTSYPKYNYSGYSVWTYNYPFAKSQPKIMERRGGILGANSVLIRMIETNKTIIILSNNNKFNPDSFGNTQGLKEALMIEMDKSN